MQRQPSKYDISPPRLDAETLAYNRDRLIDERLRAGAIQAIDLEDLQLYRAHLVNEDSPISMREAVNTLAGYFQRECKFDSNQYPIVNESPGTREAWLWAADEDNNPCATGAALFYEDKFTAPPGSGLDGQWAWVLGFVWLHPYERDKGRLSALWEGWKTRYPGFVVEQPWSRAMSAFLERHPHTYFDGLTTTEILQSQSAGRS